MPKRSAVSPYNAAFTVVAGNDKALLPAQILANAKTNPNVEPGTAEIMMFIEGKEIGTIGNFITVTGIEKAGKGVVLSGILAAALSHTDIWGIKMRLPEDRKRVALFDTEQSERDFLRYTRNIRTQIGCDLPDTFDAFRMRNVEPNTIVLCIEEYLRGNPQTSFIVLDGLLDLVGSFFNDTERSDSLVRKIMSWPERYNCFIIGVLHRSKSVGNTLGHFGSMSNRKAQSVLLVQKDPETKHIVLSGEYIRTAGDFTPIELKYDTWEHKWMQTDYQAETEKLVKRMILKPSELDISVHKTNVARIFNSQEVQPYKTLVQNISEIYASGQNWAKQCIPHLINECLIFKSEHGYSNRQQARLYIQQ